MKHYFAKILLFGEHTVNRGSRALAIPYPAFSGSWQRAADPALQQQLPQLADYLADLPALDLDVEAFRRDLAEGWHFAADIPMGYGLGSSGALCAAIYERYAHQPILPSETHRLGELRQILAQIEQFFHGKSSGTDPLICYLQQPILIHPDGQIQTVHIPRQSPLTFFLLDTQTPRRTEPMVAYFLERCADPAFADKVATELAAYNNFAIAAFLQAEWDNLFEDMTNISRFQMEHLAAMTPDHFHAVWNEGLQGNLYRLKLCGAGGGGFILGCTGNWPAAQAALSGYVLQKAYPWGKP